MIVSVQGHCVEVARQWSRPRACAEQVARRARRNAEHSDTTRDLSATTVAEGSHVHLTRSTIKCSGNGSILLFIKRSLLCR